MDAHSLGMASISSPCCIAFACRPSRSGLLRVWRRQQGRQQPVDEAPSDALRFSDLLRRPILSLLQQPFPPMRPRQRPDQRLIRPWRRRGPRVAAIGSDDHFPAAAAFPDHRDGDDDGFAVKLPSWRRYSVRSSCGDPQPELLNKAVQPFGAQPHLHVVLRQIYPLDQQPHDPRPLFRDTRLPAKPSRSGRHALGGTSFFRIG